MKKTRSPLRTIGILLAVLAALVIYAYGFQVTEVNLSEIKDPNRNASLTRVLRALANPDIFYYEQEVFEVNLPYRIPCPAEGFEPPVQDTSGPYLTVTPTCADPRATVTIEGFNFEPNANGPLNFIGSSGVRLRLVDSVTTDANGYFIVTGQLPNRGDEAEQAIRMTTRRNVGAPKLSQTAYDTWEKIVETVFLALLATTAGTALAIPISFFAARNLMKDVKSSLSGLALSILSWPAGIWVGFKAASIIGDISQRNLDSPWINIGIILLIGIGVFYTVRWALPQEETVKPSLATRIGRISALAVVSVFVILAVFLFARLLISFGNATSARIGFLGFLPGFFADLGEILNLLVSSLAAIAGGAVVSSLTGRLTRNIFERSTRSTRFLLNLVLGAIAGAVLLILIMQALNWFYQFNNLMVTVVYPGVLGAVLGILAAVRTRKVDDLPVGLVVYNITRTTLNALRAVEALIMVIVFAVWVGIGPFAGVLALSLHTIAALAKLYSEQVESISQGPLEAVKATGATRLQTIIYAVIPQIIPPYISFTMYRWDINVRMSTIIGFAGGGGIGFLLQQNINLLNYRAAAAQMLAIAVVVALMDYLSSYMREKFV